MNDERRLPRIGSSTWYDRAETRLHSAWGRDRALEWIERCAAVGWWTLLLPAKEWTWSDGMYRLHGGERAALSLDPGAQALLQRVMPEERSRLANILATFDEASNIPRREVRAEYWVPSDGPIRRRVRLHGQLEPVSGTGRISWAGCTEDVTARYLSARALSALEAAEDALARWRAFAPSLEHLLRGLAAALDSPLAMAWTRGANGRLETRLAWNAPGAPEGTVAGRASGTEVGPHHRSLARTVRRASRWPGAGGSASPRRGRARRWRR